jgi:hypothetical protein
MNELKERAVRDTRELSRDSSRLKVCSTPFSWPAWARARTGGIESSPGPDIPSGVFDELVEERAAIMEHDGGLSRVDADLAAGRDADLSIRTWLKNGSSEHARGGVNP